MNARHASLSVAPGHGAQEGHWPTAAGLSPSEPAAALPAALVDHGSQLTLNSMRILVIEDDREAAAYLVRALKEAGHVVEHAADGEEGVHMAGSGRHDVMIVDRMLPRLDGLSLLKQLRMQGNTTPALILSALGQVDDRVEGLRSGGDDYLPKPYAFSELLARIEVVARRRRSDEIGTEIGRAHV